MKKYLTPEALLIVAFLILQGLDGSLTYLVLSLGEWVEGNPVLLFAITMFGAALALYGAKVVAGLLGIFIYLKAPRGKRHILLTLVALHLVAAILPWLWIIHTTAPR